MISKQAKTLLKLNKTITGITTLLIYSVCLLPAKNILAAPEADTNNKLVVATRRITESQYKNTILDIFGGGIEINGRFEPEQREALLLAIGSSQLSISAAGFNQYFSIARSIASHVVHEENRDSYLPCKPGSFASRDDACTGKIIERYGRLLFRRPLTKPEVQARVELAAQGAESAKDYYRGVQLALVSLLSAPEFLFRVEVAEPDPDSNQYRLDAYTKAARLSHLIWDRSPDETLLKLAESGDIHSKNIVEKEIKRLLDSPYLEDGTRAFFSDMLHLDRYATLTKDSQLFPKFSQEVANSAKEQTLKTVVNHLISEQGDYRELLTTRKTFINRSLAALYKIPFLANEGWMEYTFSEESHQSGLLTQISLAAVFSHPGRSSPTLRGMGVNEIFLCTPTPTPPANVDFSIINDTNNPNLRTSRMRLEAHAEDPACSGCHNLMDPLGVALEHFDAMGQRRLYENGELIDVKANFLGQEFEGSLGLGKTLYNSPLVHSCLVRNVYAYGIGREPTTTEKNTFVKEHTQRFAKNDFSFISLLEEITSADEFFAVPATDEIAKRQMENQTTTTSKEFIAGDL